MAQIEWGQSQNNYNSYQNNNSNIEMVGGLMSGATSAFSNVAGVVQGIKNYEMADNENAYRHRLQDRFFDREDNAIQRRVADLRAAGLSPTLAAGNAAQAGPVVSTQAPQMNLGNFKNPVSDSIDSISRWMQMKQTQAQINQTEAQTELIRQQKQFNDQYNPSKLEQAELSNIGKELANSFLSRNLETAVSTEQERLIAIRIENSISEATREYDIQLARNKLSQSAQNILTNELEITAKKLGITQRELEITSQKINNEIASSTKDTTISQTQNRARLLIATILAQETANKSAENQSTAAYAKAQTDLMNLDFWRNKGMSPAEAENTLKTLQVIFSGVGSVGTAVQRYR